MKRAAQIWHDEQPDNYGNGAYFMPEDWQIRAMRTYAKQVAEQALKDAADGVYSERTLGMTIKQGILSTPILTP